MQRLGIFGGSFNPPHKGHIYIAQEAMRAAALDKVIFIPCGNPPHKDAGSMASAEDRFEMTRLAIKGNADFEISDIEIKESGFSFTAKTLKKLSSIYPKSKLCFIVGSDSFCDLDGWYHPEEIFKMAEIVVVNRGGTDLLPIDEKAKDYKQKYNAVISETDIVPMEISSSQIRTKISCGDDTSKLIEADVLDYIKKFDVYKDAV